MLLTHTKISTLWKTWRCNKCWWQAFVKYFINAWLCITWSYIEIYWPMCAIIWVEIFYNNTILQKRNKRVHQENSSDSSIKNPDEYKKKYHTETKAVWSAWFIEKMNKKPPPIKGRGLRNKYKEGRKEEETNKSIWVVNNSWNNRKFQLHCNKLEWVDPRTWNCKNNYFWNYTYKLYTKGKIKHHTLLFIIRQNQ